MDFNITNKEEFVDTLLENYLARGFGSLSKSEIDILMMHLLLKYSDLSCQTNHNLSLNLQLTETRLKNLQYQARLKYETDHAAFIKGEFFKLIEKAQLVADAKDNSVIFIIENSFVKQGVKAQLKSIGHFADHSFNSEIVKIKEDAFVDLLSVYFDTKQKKEIVKAAKKAMKKATDISFNDVMHEFIKGMIRKSAGKTIEFIAAGLTGGLSDAGVWISGIKKAFEE